MTQQHPAPRASELPASSSDPAARGLSDDAAEAHAELAIVQRERDELRPALTAARDREHLLAYELQHRVRNMLAVIRSIYRRTLEFSAGQDEFVQHFQDRLDAVGRHHARVGYETAGVDLEEVLRDELMKTYWLDRPGCTISGPLVFLDGKTGELMALAIHELTVNSIKFGAVAQDGTLSIEWSLIETRTGTMLRFRWREAGVSSVAPAPRRCGFGRQLIEEALPFQLGGRTSFDLRPGGVDCTIELPLRSADAWAGYTDPVPAAMPMLSNDGKPMT